MTRRDDSRIIRIVHPICCGLDVHKESVSACVIFPDSKGEEVWWQWGVLQNSPQMTE
jgi:hypothetical protein